MSGKTVEILLAIIVLPLPGGPIINRLCPPAVATSAALLADSWPIISEKSILYLLGSICVNLFALLSFLFSNRKLIISVSDSAPNISISFANIVSSKSHLGIIILFIPSLWASKQIGNIPLTWLILPSKDNSPIKIVSINLFFIMLILNIPCAEKYA